MSFFNHKFVVAPFVFLLILPKNTHFVQAAEETPPLTKCFIRIDNPHLSKSIKQIRDFDAVKVNAISICDRDVWSLTITVEIRKTGFLRNHEVVKRTLKREGIIFSNSKVEHKGTWRRCESNRMSSYFGVAYAEAIIEGQRMRTLPVTTAKTVSLACGT
ncbi:MAG: hypothetical protein EBW15_08315 [Actinobacteria bacterium]|nr:hypothetical protein [Actinomycetota bacterium]